MHGVARRGLELARGLSPRLEDLGAEPVERLRQRRPQMIGRDLSQHRHEGRSPPSGEECTRGQRRPQRRREAPDCQVTSVRAVLPVDLVQTGQRSDSNGKRLSAGRQVRDHALPHHPRRKGGAPAADGCAAGERFGGT